MSACLITMLSETSNLLNESLHFFFGDGAVSVLVEFFETFFEVTLGELTFFTHLGQRILNESFSLSLVKMTTVVFIVGLPDIVNAILDDGVNVGHLLLFIFRNYKIY